MSSFFDISLNFNQIIALVCSSTLSFNGLIRFVLACRSHLFVYGVDGLITCCSVVAGFEVLSATLGHLSVQFQYLFYFFFFTDGNSF